MKAIPLTIAAVIAVAPANVLAQPFQPDPAAARGTRLDIVAEGEVLRTPDIAIVSAGVTNQAPTAGAAMQDNARSMSGVIAALRKAGIADRDIRTSSINLQPQYRYQENQPPQLVGYQASNTVQVTFRKISESGKIIDTLVANGANQINGPSFSVEKADVALDEARTNAIAKARARAELYAKAAGLKVKRILSISEGGMASPPMPYPAPRVYMAKTEADTTVQPGQSPLSVSVNVSFELE